MRDELNNSIKKGRNPGLLWESQRQSRVLTVTRLRGSNSCPVCLLFNFKLQSGRIGPRWNRSPMSTTAGRMPGVATRAATGSAALAAARSEGRKCVTGQREPKGPEHELGCRSSVDNLTVTSRCPLKEIVVKYT